MFMLMFVSYTKKHFREEIFTTPGNIFLNFQIIIIISYKINMNQLFMAFCLVQNSLAFYLIFFNILFNLKLDKKF